MRYATVEDFEGYVEGWVTDDEPALERLLDRATRDIDSLLVPRAVIGSGTYAGHRVDPTRLATWAREALARATCAQAEYRYELTKSGEAELVVGRPAKVKGPDFEVEHSKGPDGGAPSIGPKVRNELAAIRFLVPTGARASA